MRDIDAILADIEILADTADLDAILADTADLDEVLADRPADADQLLQPAV